MKPIIVSLLFYIQIQYHIIKYLLVLLVGKNVINEPVEKTPINQLYQQMQVNSFPKIETTELLDYKKLIAQYKRKYSF